MKNIAISRSLSHLKDELQDLGYRIIFHDEIEYPVDVYVYQDDDAQESLYSANQVLSSITRPNPTNSSKHSGTLLINGKGKSLNDIQYIINKRVYLIF